jgi:dihydroorotate dehydrogenase
MEAEKAHTIAMNGLKFFCKLPFGKKLIAFLFTPKGEKPITLWNINFPNRIGLGAGFDKNANYLNELEALGFGFVEIGTVTPKAQEGNLKPRLIRLKKDGALINRMGFNNDGVERIAQRLKKWKEKKSELVVGGNIGKNKNTPNEAAWMDYVICFKALYPFADYFVVNVSSPNTPGLRALQDQDPLRIIFEKLFAEREQQALKKPILLKIAPDLPLPQVDAVIALCEEMGIDGLVVSNTTLNRDNLSEPSKKQSEQFGAGGLSGKPLLQQSTGLVKYIKEKSFNKITIIGSGGIFTKSDAAEKSKAGAALVQVWTGFIYEGPGIVKKLTGF